MSHQVSDNYGEPGGDRWVVGGRLSVTSSGLLEFPVESGTSGTQLNRTGLTHFGSASQSTYTLQKPGQAGVVKYLVCTDGSTGGPVQKVRVSTGGGGVKVGAGTTNLALNFTSTGASVTLVSRSTDRWDVISPTTPLTASTGKGVFLSTG